MEKIRMQILVDAETYSFLNSFCIDNRLKNNSEAVRELVLHLKRLKIVISNLEKAAWKQTEIDGPAVAKFKKDCEEQQILKGVVKE